MTRGVRISLVVSRFHLKPCRASGFRFMEISSVQSMIQYSLIYNEDFMTSMRQVGTSSYAAPRTLDMTCT